LQAGARGYVLKSVVREELLRAIREICNGRRYLDPAVVPLLSQREGHRSLSGPGVGSAGSAADVAKGLGNKEIAAALPFLPAEDSVWGRGCR
jgi:DNA-binding NarL/FixJ family response regulator